MTTVCPNCEATMDDWEGASCPECGHIDDPDCECQACDESRENAAEQAELRMEVDGE